MTIDEAKTEVRNIEKYYDFNHQTNDYDVLVNITEIANLILLQNKISYNKAIDNVESEFLMCDKVHYNLQDILNVLNKVKEGEKNENTRLLRNKEM